MALFLLGGSSMVGKISLLIAPLLLVLASVSACSTEPKAGTPNAGVGKQPAAVNDGGTGAAGAAANTDGTAASTEGTAAAAGATQTKVDPKAAATVAVGGNATSASGWCAAAGQTAIVKSAGMAKAFGLLCVGGKATELLATTLVKTAYSGTGSPALQMINPIAAAGGTVTALFGVGIKLPINSKAEWDAAIGQGSAENAIQLIKNVGDTPGKVTATPVASNADKGWVRGWTMQNASSKKVAIVTIKTDYITQIDQYNFGNGYYMYTSQIKKSIETMKDYQLLTASFDIGGVGYLLTISQIAADDHGFSDIAKTTVTEIATATIKFQYTIATAAPK